MRMFERRGSGVRTWLPSWRRRRVMVARRQGVVLKGKANDRLVTPAAM